MSDCKYYHSDVIEKDSVPSHCWLPSQRIIRKQGQSRRWIHVWTI